MRLFAILNCVTEGAFTSPVHSNFIFICAWNVVRDLFWLLEMQDGDYVSRTKLVA